MPNFFKHSYQPHSLLINFFIGSHVTHLESLDENELNKLLGMVVDVENIFMAMHKEEDEETKRVYYYLFKV